MADIHGAVMGLDGINASQPHGSKHVANRSDPNLNAAIIGQTGKPGGNR